MKKTPLVIVLLAALAGCSELESKSNQEKTIDLLAAGTWKVDSLVYTVKSESPGMSVINFDSVYLNAGTWEFKKPGDSGPGYNTGYLFHHYMDGTTPKTDTLAWTPYNFDSPSSDIDQLTIFIPDTTLLVRQIVLNDTKNIFQYLKKETASVRIEGGFGFDVGSGATRVSHQRRYHLTR
ncbi:MAG: membrane lipoprotein lipid attachment site-containing protein [Cyclobacteriaceae bacterium]|nr:membrane lipoprotein lipid attachment site-containing protein [Cyclobacteriaceae bacterium]